MRVGVSMARAPLNPIYWQKDKRVCDAERLFEEINCHERENIFRATEKITKQNDGLKILKPSKKRPQSI